METLHLALREGLVASLLIAHAICGLPRAEAAQNLPSTRTDDDALLPLQSMQNRATSYATNYLVVGLARNMPVARTQHDFAAGMTQPFLSYRYELTEAWSMALTVQYKALQRRDEEGNFHPFALAAFSQTSAYRIRLYHPLYVLPAFKVYYLLPTTQGRPSLRRHTDYTSELGIAVHGKLDYELGPNHALSLSVERWRGTKTTRFQGVEIGLALGFVL